ncbi:MULTISPECIES: NPCBM/NEW2 domain-containing protein [unclassified Bacillus (in: firmicutes)]|uniref:NPCBM/NEW2 domain-containing protein n=1 Tax=unclassified Bacillus (in: firmicutes) TaxID=185979 RepID=UPI001BE8BD99|nr:MULTISPECIES: NPCBM/NEW2 domain-containing protein [unclassified Bacillus (in: firmicutes)]MBT2614139.1 NPCBM/NEW2 domain-containing protein [Bacillus sp. ISL-78]MBT2629350.1 NPCBM/NEW2 domain-containing protein [Bacillus sp. ISL-101]
MKKKIYIYTTLLALLFGFIVPSSNVEAATSNETLQKKVKTLEATINTQKKTISNKDKEIKSLKATNDTQKKTISNKDKEIKSLKSTNDTQKKTISNKDKEIKSLKATNDTQKKTISNKDKEITTLKAKVPVVSTGKIYKDGVSSGSSQFISMGNNDYVEVENLVPLLTTYDDTKIKFDRNSKNLFLGIMPSNGVIGLTNLKLYDESDNNFWSVHLNKWPSGSFSINDKLFSRGIGAETTSDLTVWARYKLDGKYSALNFKYGLGNTFEGKGTITVLGDDQVLFESGVLDKMEDPKQLQIDVKGVKFLRFEFNSVDGDHSSSIIAEPVLIP